MGEMWDIRCDLIEVKNSNNVLKSWLLVFKIIIWNLLMRKKWLDYEIKMLLLFGFENEL